MSQQSVCDICSRMLHMGDFAMEIGRDDKAWDQMSEGVYLNFCRKCVEQILKPALDDYLKPLQALEGK